VSANLVTGRASDIGRVRKVNEDAACILTNPGIRPGLDALLAVADGIGGQNAGQTASSMAVEILCRHYSDMTEYKKGNSNCSGIIDEAELLRSTIELVNADIYNHSLFVKELNGMGTTLVAALLAGNRLITGNVGDSRAYLIDNDRIVQLTEDHSWVAEQVRSGLMQPEEAEVHPWRNVISRAVGTQADVSVDIRNTEITTGNTVILCSDGLCRMVTEDEILEAVISEDSLQTVCENLVNLANIRGGPDNITIVAATRID
jgi:serine/threonine protein phosphatase PrpC